jgi:predicted MPP superfamily phosphohydrolase
MRCIHFGCWNQIQCPVVNNYRDIVIDYIKQNEQDSAFMIVAGDNWYNNKSTDPSDNQIYKFYFTNILKSGLYKLYDIKKPCYMILGNHDEAVDSSVLNIKKDCMLNTIKYYIKEINKGTSDIPTPALQDLAMFASSKQNEIIPERSSQRSPNKSLANKETQLVLFESKSKIDSIEYGNNVVIIFINTNIFESSVDATISSYMAKLEEKLQEYPGKKKFVVGHNQILSQSTNKIKKFCKNDNTIKKVIELLSSHFVIYLCADTHNFQITKIKNIVQVLVGTGGAIPDALSAADNKVSFTYNSYTIEGYYHNSYGYSLIDIDDNGTIKVIYKHLIDIDGNPVSKEFVYQIDYSTQHISMNSTTNITQLTEDMIQINKNVAEELCTHLNVQNLVKNTSTDIKDSNDKYCYKGAK